MGAMLLGVLVVAGCATTDNHGMQSGSHQMASVEPAVVLGEAEKPPTDTDKCRERAIALWQDDKHDEARQLLCRVITQSPDDVDLRLVLVRVLVDDNQINDASRELDEMKNRWPWSASPYVLSGYIHIRGDDFPAAEQEFRGALRRSVVGQERIATHLGLGAVLEQTGRQYKADAQYAAAIALAPELRKVLIDIQKQRLMPLPVALETRPGEVSPRARLRAMEKILRRMDKQK